MSVPVTVGQEWSFILVFLTSFSVEKNSFPSSESWLLSRFSWTVSRSSRVKSPLLTLDFFSHLVCCFLVQLLLLLCLPRDLRFFAVACPLSLPLKPQRMWLSSLVVIHPQRQFPSRVLVWHSKGERRAINHSYHSVACYIAVSLPFLWRTLLRGRMFFSDRCPSAAASALFFFLSVCVSHFCLLCLCLSECLEFWDDDRTSRHSRDNTTGFVMKGKNGQTSFSLTPLSLMMSRVESRGFPPIRTFALTRPSFLSLRGWLPLTLSQNMCGFLICSDEKKD